MKLKYLLVVLLGIGWSIVNSTASNNAARAYDFSFKTLEGHKPFPLKQFHGKVLLIVNTASKCGFTPQYDALEKLYKTYKNQGLVVIGVPSNDFGKQEPGSDTEIANFCRLNYGVSFPMTAKEHVIGDLRHPFYAWINEQLGLGSAPKWNFHKYLIDRDGHAINYFYSMTAPDSKRLIKAIEDALNKPASVVNPD